MSRTSPWWWAFSLASAILASEGRAEEARRVDFERDVRPIFERHCLRCHGPSKQKSGFRLDSRGEALRGGDSGEPAIVPGHAEESRLFRLVAGSDPGGVMPPKGPKLRAEEIRLLRDWIDQGVTWPETARTVETGAATATHWSLTPLTLPAVPRMEADHPIDAFIRSRLREKGLAPSPEADRRTLIRRLTFGLHGLPPTPEEIDAFLEDRRHDAYERLVDRLLESPRYGERWARHWMDVVHFAETHGNDQDRPRPNAWPYRDYLIRAFNDDKPYARFVAEQVAGDVIAPGDPWAVVALGLIAAGPWDESSQRDIRDDTVDKKIAQNLDRDDMVATTMATFTSTTVHCARCHDHKFDPIRQSEYYGLQAVFAGVDRADRPYLLDPKAESLRRPLEARKAALLTRKKEVVDPLLTDEERAEIARSQAAWEATATDPMASWNPLTPHDVATTGGATATLLADGSVRMGGIRPETDTYTLRVRTPATLVRAIRLEVLTDESLPLRGPGRQDNGNLHLSEFQVLAAPLSNPRGTPPTPVKIAKAAADYDQPGWTASAAIDGNPGTAWGIHPEVGKPHQVVFELATPIRFEGGVELTCVLGQVHGRGHLIGRPRLSVTASDHPDVSRPLPDRVARVLAIPAGRRTPAEAGEVESYYYGMAATLDRAIERATSALAAVPAIPLVYAACHDFTPEGSFHPANAPRPVSILRRGDIHSPIGPATPGALSCVPGLGSRLDIRSLDDEGSRREALARWLVDPANVLTWRSIANRVWHYHFGRGIVDSPNDFGRMGARPSHPELLDWLAVTFRDGGGSFKALHRLILRSRTYRQECRLDPIAAKADAENALLWRMNRTRLDAESVRDAVLSVSGTLDLTMGGPSVKQFVQSPGVHVTPVVDYLGFDVDSPASRRRSVYRFLFRTLPDPFMDAMDCPDSSQLSPKRNTSVTALQALAMLNDRFIVRQSEHFATRLTQLSSHPADRIRLAYLLALGRPPTAEESLAVGGYAARFGLANACRVLLNCNEFLFVN